ncbi:di-N-acetylchitobiase-like [Mustelus asterias]
MRWILALVEVLNVLVQWIAGDSELPSPPGWCPCSNLELCRSVPTDHQHQVEVIVFDHGEMDYQHYDWSKVTAVVLSDRSEKRILCVAHENKARVLLQGKITTEELTNQKSRKAWLRRTTSFVKILDMDGIYLEMQGITRPGSLEYEALSHLINDITVLLHRAIPGSQVIMNVPWSPTCPGGRCYDFVTIAKSCDFLIVMSFNIQDQMWDECFAKANAPYDQIFAGLAAYIRLGIDSRKLLMGIPWFGYDYPCMQLFEAGRCRLRMSPHGGALCSSIVATQIRYKDIVQLLPRSITGRYWDDNYKSPYFVYKVNNTFHEVWYDDPESISLRSTIVRKLNLGGVGAWFGNSLNYSVNPIAAMQTEEMWNALYPPMGGDLEPTLAVCGNGSEGSRSGEIRRLRISLVRCLPPFAST